MSDNGIDQLKQHEGLRLLAYDDAQPNKNITSETQVKGTLTIGFGHTHKVYPQQRITIEQATQFLKEDVIYFENIVTNKVKVDLNQNQFDALVGFVYNIGEGNFAKSTLLKKLNANDYIGASEQFLVWNKPASILKRREDSKALFMLDYGILKPINPSAKNLAGDIAMLGLGLLFLV